MAHTHRQRRRGLRPRPAGCGLLLKAASVHGFGMREPLRVVSLDRGGRVRRVGLLLPRRVLWDPGAVWTIELPLSHRPPEPGMVLRVVPILAPCPGR